MKSNVENNIDRILKRYGITEETCVPEPQSKLSRFMISNIVGTSLGSLLYKAVRKGVEIGMEEHTIEGQRIKLQYSAKTPKQEEYLKKLYALHDEYGMGFRYHPLYGMELFELEKQ